MSILWLWFFQVALFVGGWLGPWRDPPERRTNGRLPFPVRLTISFSLVIAAFALWQGRLGLPAYAQWVAWGMAASFVGDLVMARVIRVPNRLIGGMLAFGLAHALYINAYVRTLQTVSAPAPDERWTTGLLVGIVFYGLIATVGWWFLVRNPLKGRVTNLGALLYGAWIALMAANALALGYALGYWGTALGGLCFVASDLIIGITEIRGVRFKNANDWVWLTYVAGQMGIVYAALAGVA